MTRHCVITIVFALVVPYFSISQTVNNKQSDSVNSKLFIDSLTMETVTRTKKELEFSDTYILVNNAQLLPSKSTIIEGHVFVFAVDFSANRNDTVYLSTKDEKFVTPEGFKVGMTFNQVRKAYAGKLFKEEGWGYFLPLPSGWSLGFCVGSSCTDRKPGNLSKVKWVFKRKPNIR